MTTVSTYLDVFVVVPVVPPDDPEQRISSKGRR
jgi:hypothetical protein